MRIGDLLENVTAETATGPTDHPLLYHVASFGTEKPLIDLGEAADRRDTYLHDAGLHRDPGGTHGPHT